MSKWISVEERLPNDGEEVLVWVDGGILDVGIWSKRDKGWVDASSLQQAFGVTHWMPLPEPPTKED